MPSAVAFHANSDPAPIRPLDAAHAYVTLVPCRIEDVKLIVVPNETIDVGGTMPRPVIMSCVTIGMELLLISPSGLVT